MPRARELARASGLLTIARTTSGRPLPRAPDRRVLPKRRERPVALLRDSGGFWLDVAFANYKPSHRIPRPQRQSRNDATRFTIRAFSGADAPRHRHDTRAVWPLPRRNPQTSDWLTDDPVSCETLSPFSVQLMGGVAMLVDTMGRLTTGRFGLPCQPDNPNIILALPILISL